jgi:hypothetical protein
MKEISCPYLKNNRCLIYNNRFKCCRNFPNIRAYCFRDCKQQCYECNDICCNHILVPDNYIIDENTISQYLNIECEDCIYL